MIAKTLSVFMLLTMVLGTSACTSSSTTVNQKYLHFDVAGFKLDRSQEPTLIFIRPGAPTLSQYSSFMVDAVQIDYSAAESLPQKEALHIRQYLRNAIISELRNGGYRVVNQPQSGTLRISPVIANVKVPSALANTVGLLAPVALSVGDVTVEAAFREGTTGRIDAVVIDRSKGSHVLNASPWSTMSDVESAFDGWAKGIRESLDEAHGR